jgi:hypothetical protein
VVNTSFWSFSSATGSPFSSMPVRISGPFVSSSTAQKMPVLSHAARSASSVSWWYSWLPCEKLNRATRMPARSIPLQDVHGARHRTERADDVGLLLGQLHVLVGVGVAAVHACVDVCVSKEGKAKRKGGTDDATAASLTFARRSTPCFFVDALEHENAHETVRTRALLRRRGDARC